MWCAFWEYISCRLDFFHVSKRLSLLKSDISIAHCLRLEKHVCIWSRNAAIPCNSPFLKGFISDHFKAFQPQPCSHQPQPLGSNRCFGLWCYCLSSCILALEDSLTLPAIVQEGHKYLRFIVLGMSGICRIQVPTWLTQQLYHIVCHYIILYYIIMYHILLYQISLPYIK